MAGRLACALCVLGLFAVAVSAQVADGSLDTTPAGSSSAKLFADWLGTSKVSTKATTASYYDELETVEACLKEVAYRNCRSINGDGTYFESSVSCCKDESRSKYPSSSRDGLLAPDDVEIGACEFEEAWFDTPIQVTSAAIKWGRFTATCTLRSAAHLCGYPFCDQMLLIAQGNIYQTEGVVSPVDPASVVPLVDESCATSSRAASAAAAKLAKNAAPKGLMVKHRGAKANRTPPKVAVASAAQPAGAVDGAAKTAKYHDGSSGRQFFTGTAVIYSGSMTIQSRKYDVKMTSGWFEYVWDMTATGTVDEAEAADSYLVTPYTYTLKFTKPGSSHS